MTHVRETHTRNSCELTCARNLYVCHTDLQQDISRASFSHQIERVLFRASFWCESFVRVSRTSFSCVCHGLYHSTSVTDQAVRFLPQKQIHLITNLVTLCRHCDSKRYPIFALYFDTMTLKISSAVTVVLSLQVVLIKKLINIFPNN